MREALGGLPDRDRLLLKLTIVSGLSHEQLANIYSVNQSTITRWIARARAQVLEATEREVCAKLRLPPGEFRSLAGLLRQPPRSQHLARARHAELGVSLRYRAGSRPR